MKKIVVIGGGAAGAKAASKAKRLNPLNHVELYTNEDKIAYSLCGLPYFIEGSVEKIENLIIRTPQDFINNGIQVFLNHNLEKIIPEKNCVLINNNHIFYDELILALGASVNIPNINNISANNIFTLRSLESGLKIKEKMQNSKTVLIIGGGYIAIELTEAFIKNGLNVKLVEIKDRLASDFDDDFSKVIQNIISSYCSDKFDLYLSQSIDEIFVDENNNFKSAKTNKGNIIEADFCVLSTGCRPNVEIPKNSGIKLGITGAIYVDEKLRTNYPNIYACGDCTEKHCIITRQPTYIGLGTIANKEGRVAAINAVNDDNYEIFDGVLKSTITRFFDYTISKTGLSVNEALSYSDRINIAPVSSTITKKDKAGYMPDSNELTLKLVADKRSGEILGAQAIGKMGNVAQRINTITSIIKTRSKVDDLLHLDLPYAPPYSGTIDPVLTAAYKLKELINK